jgi:hypothetical protein
LAVLLLPVGRRLLLQLCVLLLQRLVLPQQLLMLLHLQRQLLLH